MNTGFYEYTQRKPKPQEFRHTGAADCLCGACLNEYRRQHPEEYVVFQSQPQEGARLNDFTQEISATLKVLGTSTDSNHRAYIKIRTAPRKQYAKAALILSL